MTSQEVWEAVGTLKESDEFEVEWRAVGAKKWRIWKGIVMKEAKVEATHRERYAQVRYPAQGPTIYFMPQDGLNGTMKVEYLMIDRISGVNTPVPKEKPKEEEEEVAERPTNIRSESDDETSEDEEDGKPAPEDEKYALDPSKWMLTVRKEIDVIRLKMWFDKNFTQIHTHPAEEHMILDILDSIKTAIDTVKIAPGVCKLRPWVKGQEKLISRLIIQQERKKGVGNQGISALQRAFEHSSRPDWITKATKLAADDLKILMNSEKTPGRTKGEKKKRYNGKRQEPPRVPVIKPSN